jgi:3-isopropylmalate/(R)-2-methylmalate dehydratase large subunit
MPGSSFAQKVLARASGHASVDVGQIVDVRPDRVLSHDNTAPIFKLFKQLGIERVRNPHNLCITLDHAVPAPTTAHAQNHAEVRQFVAAQGVRFFFEVGRGICHQVFSEEAIVWPGMLIVGSDSHTPHFGWMGAFGAGIGRSEVAAVWATGEIWMRVPETMRVTLTGALKPGVTTKDFCLKLIGDHGQDGGLYRAIEFNGPALAGLSIDSRMVIPNMMAEFGAKTAYMPPDDLVFDDLSQRATRWNPAESAASLRRRIVANALYPDADAPTALAVSYDLSTLEPMIAKPHRVDNVVPLSQVAGTRVHQAWIGTCTNGRLEDIAAACAVLRGRKIASGTRLLWNPASSEVLKAALRLGHVETFLEAGGHINTPGCGPCMGNHMGVPAVGEVVIASANRNFRGRMGTRDSEVYLASPAVVAASAVAGSIAGPGDV